MAETMSDTTTERGVESSGLTMLNLCMPVVDVSRYEGTSVFSFTASTTHGELFTLSGDNYPVLSRIWDNEEDDIFDNL